ncbi:MAG: methyl-accepting chemotaxis protein [candidate division WOR-3 bacterium]
MKLSNKIALISTVLSILIGTPILFSSLYWFLSPENYKDIFLNLLSATLFLSFVFYFIEENKLKKAIVIGDGEILYSIPMIYGFHIFLNFGVFLFLFYLILRSLFGFPSLEEIFKALFSFLSIGGLEFSIIYFLSFSLLSPKFKELKDFKFKGLNLGKKISFFGSSVIIFSFFVGYIASKSPFCLIYLIFAPFLLWVLIKIVREPILEIREKLQNFTRDFSVIERKVISGDEIEEIDDSVTLFIKDRNSLIFRLKDAYEKINTQAEAILTGIERLASSTSKVNKFINEILSIKDESGGVINSVHKKNEGIYSLSTEIESQIKTFIHSSKDSIDLANSTELRTEEKVERITAFVKKVKEGSRVLEELSKAFEEIKEINFLMEQISEDTNLLALNASIEAVRKEGEESKGFAVIAEEIRKLSNDSASYLEKIRENIKRMDEAVNSIVATTEESISIFEETKSIIQKTKEDLKKISESIVINTNMAEQISGILKEGYESTDEIRKLSNKLSQLNDKQVENALLVLREMEEETASIEEARMRIQTLISLTEKIKEL